MLTSTLLVVTLLGPHWPGQEPPPQTPQYESVRVAAMRLTATCQDGKPCLALQLVRGGAKATPESTEWLIASEGLASELQARFGDRTAEVVEAAMPFIGRGLTSSRKTLRVAAGELLTRLQSHGLVRFHTRLKGVTLSETIEPRVERLAARYFRQTGKRLVVTSGARNATSQAQAMYSKVRAGGSILHEYRRSSAARAINKAYVRGRKAKKSADEVVADMAAEITGQITRGVFISKHLVSGAVDVRSRNLTRSQRRSLIRAARAEPKVSVLEERHPPHFHITFR